VSPALIPTALQTKEIMSRYDASPSIRRSKVKDSVMVFRGPFDENDGQSQVNPFKRYTGRSRYLNEEDVLCLTTLLKANPPLYLDGLQGLGRRFTGRDGLSKSRCSQNYANGSKNKRRFVQSDPAYCEIVNCVGSSCTKI